MNKAFVREPDTTVDVCPRCGSAGESVGSSTLGARLTDEQRRNLADPASFCPVPRCYVAYFDKFERCILADDLTESAYPKDPTAPICPCFGLTCEDIERDVAEQSVTRVRAAIERAKSPDARCAERSANGRSCIAYVQQYYMKCRNQAAGD